MAILPESLPIEPRGPLEARVRVPGSKSITNRALLIAALAEGESTLAGLGFTGLPSRLHPTAVATVENFDPADVIEKTGAEVVVPDDVATITVPDV